jgi:hypothetical protein
LALGFCSEIDGLDGAFIIKSYAAYAVTRLRTCPFNNQFGFFPLCLGR